MRELYTQQLKTMKTRLIQRGACRIAEKGRVHRNGHQPDGTGD